MPKGWEQVVAVLGILMADCVYLPIDIDNPSERNSFLLHNSNAQALLTKQVLNEPASPSIPVFRVEGINSISEWGQDRESTKPEDLAYIIYASGSTGTPKGVMIFHESASNIPHDINEKFAVTNKDSAIAISNLHFDLSVYDIFGVLAAGGSIVIPDPELAREPKHWCDLIVRYGVTLWNSVPALLRMLCVHLEAHPEIKLETLREALVSGDRVPLDLHENCQTPLARHEFNQPWWSN